MKNIKRDWDTLTVLLLFTVTESRTAAWTQMLWLKGKEKSAKEQIFHQLKFFHYIIQIEKVVPLLF